MAKDFEEYMFEDECCLNCGELNYIPSRTPGVCRECMIDNSGAERTLENVEKK
jgi:hypothetical protein